MAPALLRPGRGLLSAFVAALVAVGAAAGGPWNGVASAAPAPAAARAALAADPPAAVPAPAAVLSASASPSRLPSAGGTVLVSGRVSGALACRVELLSRQGAVVGYPTGPEDCTNGSFSAQVTIGPNDATSRRTVALALVAANGVSSYVGRVYVSVAAVVPATVLAASASPSALPGAGGTVTVAAVVRNASTCQLQVLSRQSFPVVYSRDPRGCGTGTFSARVTIGPNTTAVARTVALALVARNGASSYPGRFFVRLAPGRPPAGQGPSAPQMSPLSTASPVVQTSDHSSNWSGYAATAGPFSAVSGTFTVPSIVFPAGPGSHVSEWVGIDGVKDAALIQAGVDESPVPGAPGRFTVQPWWEILPAAETEIPSVKVSAGDQVTVSIWRAAGGDWTISLTDVTDGQSFTSPPLHYAGDGSSAEWIVEAASQCDAQCTTAQLAAYSPAVVFSGMAVNGRQASLDQITLHQGGIDVSTPSAISGGRFNVTYTGANGT